MTYNESLAWFIDNNSDAVHNLRYARTYDFLRDNLKTDSRILELGGKSAFSSFLSSHTACTLSNCDSDLRGGFGVFPNTQDIVLCMEVIEHIKDLDTVADLAVFTGSGIRNMLSESFIALRPGGMFFLTTPNVCSHYNVFRLVRGHHPYMYQPHHRELAPRDVYQYLDAAGFVDVSFWTEDVWAKHHMPNSDIVSVQGIFDRTEPVDMKGLRGDCIFAVGYKPTTDRA